MKQYLFIFLFFSINWLAKGQDIDLANEYFKQGEYEKAKDIYLKISKDKNNIRLIHQNFVQCLFKLKNFDEAGKYFKRQIKSNDLTGIVYRSDYINLLEITGKFEEAQKEMEILIDLAARTEGTIYELQDILYRNSKTELVIQLFNKSREIAKDQNKYALLMARAYLYNGQKESMIEEMLKYGLI